MATLDANGTAGGGEVYPNDIRVSFPERLVIVAAASQLGTAGIDHLGNAVLD